MDKEIKSINFKTCDFKVLWKNMNIDFLCTNENDNENSSIIHFSYNKHLQYFQEFITHIFIHCVS